MASTSLIFFSILFLSHQASIIETPLHFQDEFAIELPELLGFETPLNELQLHFDQSKISIRSPLPGPPTPVASNLEESLLLGASPFGLRGSNNFQVLSYTQNGQNHWAVFEWSSEPRSLIFRRRVSIDPSRLCGTAVISNTSGTSKLQAVCKTQGSKILSLCSCELGETQLDCIDLEGAQIGREDINTENIRTETWSHRENSVSIFYVSRTESGSLRGSFWLELNGLIKFFRFSNDFSIYKIQIVSYSETDSGVSLLVVGRLGTESIGLYSAEIIRGKMMSASPSEVRRGPRDIGTGRGGIILTELEGSNLRILMNKLDGVVRAVTVPGVSGIAEVLVRENFAVVEFESGENLQAILVDLKAGIHCRLDIPWMVRGVLLSMLEESKGGMMIAFDVNKMKFFIVEFGSLRHLKLKSVVSPHQFEETENNTSEEKTVDNKIDSKPISKTTTKSLIEEPGIKSFQSSSTEPNPLQTAQQSSSTKVEVFVRPGPASLISKSLELRLNFVDFVDPKMDVVSPISSESLAKTWRDCLPLFSALDSEIMVLGCMNGKLFVARGIVANEKGVEFLSGEFQGEEEPKRFDDVEEAKLYFGRFLAVKRQSVVEVIPLEVGDSMEFALHEESDTHCKLDLRGVECSGELFDFEPAEAGDSLSLQPRTVEAIRTSRHSMKSQVLTSSEGEKHSYLLLAGSTLQLPSDELEASSPVLDNGAFAILYRRAGALRAAVLRPALDPKERLVADFVVGECHRPTMHLFPILGDSEVAMLLTCAGKAEISAWTISLELPLPKTPDVPAIKGKAHTLGRIQFVATEEDPSVGTVESQGWRGWRVRGDVRRINILTEGTGLRIFTAARQTFSATLSGRGAASLAYVGGKLAVARGDRLLRGSERSILPYTDCRVLRWVYTVSEGRPFYLCHTEGSLRLVFTDLHGLRLELPDDSTGEGFILEAQSEIYHLFIREGQTSNIRVLTVMGLVRGVPLLLSDTWAVLPPYELSGRGILAFSVGFDPKAGEARLIFVPRTSKMLLIRSVVVDATGSTLLGRLQKVDLESEEEGTRWVAASVRQANDLSIEVFGVDSKWLLGFRVKLTEERWTSKLEKAISNLLGNNPRGSSLVFNEDLLILAQNPQSSQGSDALLIFSLRNRPRVLGTLGAQELGNSDYSLLDFSLNKSQNGSNTLGVCYLSSSPDKPDIPLLQVKQFEVGRTLVEADDHAEPVQKIELSVDFLDGSTQLISTKFVLYPDPFRWKLYLTLFAFLVIALTLTAFFAYKIYKDIPLPNQLQRDHLADALA